MRTDDYDLLFDRELVVVRWRQPTVESANQLHHVLARHQAELGRPLFFAIIIGPDCPPPDLATRDALLRGHDQVVRACQTVRMVLVGDSMRQTVMRTIVIALNLAASLRGKRVEVDKDIHELVAVIEQVLGRTRDATIQLLLDANMLEPDELGERAS